MSRINTERVDADGLFDLLKALVYHHNTPQFSATFDWQNGEWEVSWPKGNPAPAQEE